MIQDLKAFLMKGNVVDLAVAVVIGAAFGLVVSSFVDNIVNPIIAAVFGKPDISSVLTFVLRNNPDGDAVLSIGGFLQEILNFAIIGAVLFFIVRAYNTMQEKRNGPAEEEAAGPSDEVLLLTEIRDSLRRQA